MKRTYLLATICLSFCTSLFSKEPSRLTSLEDGIEERIKRLEQDTGIDTRPEKTTFFFFGEFIYWKASLDGVAYATTAKVELDPVGDTVFNDFKTRTVHFDYSPAFQVGIGFGLPYDHWDVCLRWLRSVSTGKDTAHGDLGILPGNKVIIDSVGLIEGLSGPPSKAKADCKVHLDVIDLVIGRTFLWSRYFWFRPYGGIRGARVKLDWDISFTQPISTPSPVNLDFTDFSADNKYWAGGFVGGFESRWDFYKGLGLFSHVSAALVYGESSEKTRQKFFSVPAGESEALEQTLGARNSTHAVKGIFDIAVGLKWEANFYKENRILLWTGYDFFYWPNATQKTINQVSRSRDRSDLSYEGFTAGARVDF